MCGGGGVCVCGWGGCGEDNQTDSVGVRLSTAPATSHSQAHRSTFPTLPQ